MLSQPIEIAVKDIKDSPRQVQNKRPAAYPKKEKKGPLPQDLEEGSLEALKQLIASQYTASLENIDAASPLLKIDPSSQVGALYNKLVQSLISVHTNGVQETTFFLDDNSIFRGAKITITEFSTAPKVFNIEFTAQDKVVALFETHAADLMIALQKKDLGFSVNRIDTSLMAEDDKYAISKVERDLDKEEDAS